MGSWDEGTLYSPREKNWWTMVPGEARKVKSRRQDETVLQEGCNNLNSQWQSTWMGVSSNSHRPWNMLLKTENQKLIQSSHWQGYLTILGFISLIILLTLSGYFSFVSHLLQISCSCVLPIFLLKYLLFSYWFVQAVLFCDREGCSDCADAVKERDVQAV